MEFVLKTYQLIGFCYISSNGAVSTNLKLYSFLMNVYYFTSIAYCAYINVYEMSPSFENSNTRVITFSVEWVLTFIHFFINRIVLFKDNRIIYQLFQNLQINKALKNLSNFVKGLVLLGFLLTIISVLPFFITSTKLCFHEIIYLIMTIIIYCVLYLDKMIVLFFLISTYKYSEEIKIDVTNSILTAKKLRHIRKRHNQLALLVLEGNLLLRNMTSFMFLIGFVRIWASSYTLVLLFVFTEKWYPVWFFSSFLTFTFNITKLLTVLIFCDKIYKEVNRLRFILI